MRRQWQLSMRIARFTMVGMTCFALQAGLLLILHGTGLHLTLANAIGFIASAQVNFALSSCFTWSDRKIPLTNIKAMAARWTSFQATVGISLFFNTAIFAFAAQLLQPVVAAGLGVLAGAVLTFLASNYLIFRTRHTESETTPEHPGDLSDHHRPVPALPRVSGAAAD